MVLTFDSRLCLALGMTKPLSLTIHAKSAEQFAVLLFISLIKYIHLSPNPKSVTKAIEVPFDASLECGRVGRDRTFFTDYDPLVFNGLK